MTRCPKCGRTVSWHRLYRTKAGVRAYCMRSRHPFTGKPEPHREELEQEAIEIWGKLHIMRQGTQLAMFGGDGE